MEINRTKEEIEAKVQQILNLTDSADEVKQLKAWAIIYFTQWLEGKREDII